MLIRFNVKNFLSFSEAENGNSEEFSMIAGKVRNKKDHLYDAGDLKILKFAAVYGANASGKSNLVKALDFMRKTVLNDLPSGSSGKYYKLNDNNKNKESYFEVEINIDDKFYSYGFEVVLSENRFTSEWLIEISSDNKDKLIFSRDIENGVLELGSLFKDRNLCNKLKVYADDVCDDDSVLFLNIMNKNKNTMYQKNSEAMVFKRVYNWFLECLDINYPDCPISDYSYMANEEKIDEVCKLISAFGTGITGFQMVEVEPEAVLSKMPLRARESLKKKLEEKIIDRNKNDKFDGFNFIMRSKHDFFMIDIKDDEMVKCITIKFNHGNSKSLFDMSEESDGTIRILDLLEVLISEPGKTYIIDELDRCLHPSLTYKFISTFLEIVKRKKIQLIVTTHESRLLDFDLLRRDEIWFIDKRYTGESDIYSLEEYNTRFDQKIDKAYLDGRYGGVPLFSTIFPVCESD